MRLPVPTALLLGLSLAATACSASSGQGASSAPGACAADAECPEGSVCIDGGCATTCPDRELQTVHFDLDEAQIRSDQLPLIEANALCLRAWRADRVRLEGHVAEVDTIDDEGEPGGFSMEYGMAVSERRASAVAHALEQRGIDAARLETVGLGDERPACSESTEACYARNRRVELVWVVTP